MLNKRRKKRIPLIAAGAGLIALLAGASLSLIKHPKLDQWFGQNNLQTEKSVQQNQPKSAVLALISLPPNERQNKLESIANGFPSPDRNRARYLLGSDLLEQKKAREALTFLEGLDKDYQLLAPYILLKQAQAYEMIGAAKQAEELRQEVVKRYPKDPAAAKALFVLGKTEQQYRDRALSEFPSHPLSWEIARQRLRANPNQRNLQLLLARYSFDQPGIVGILDQVMYQASSATGDTTLKPEDWETIALGYWENNIYERAASAYSKAPRTPLNLYRVGRGYQLDKKQESATNAYQGLIKAFPEAPETGNALLNLAAMAKIRQDALPYLDKVIAKFPEKAGKALTEKAEILEALNNKKAADEARQTLISKFGASEEAAEYRWEVALKKAEAKDYKAAWQWAGPIPTNNPQSILAPRAGFWVGKWAKELGRKEDAKKAFEYVLAEFPFSYYAWRSAGIMGLNVGNFNTVRQMMPEIIPPQRPVPLAGSETFKELYLLGDDEDAWMRWQTEFVNKKKPTIGEQFTEGLMRMTQGQNLSGIAKISTLEDRETPAEKAEYQELSKQIFYWQARYPFPYQREIKQWSSERKLNPLMVVALMRQESRFEPKIRSVVGATGLMQVMPSTGKWIAEKINLEKYDLENPNDNIKFGTWYLDHTHDQYDNNSLLAIASYNAGPGNVSKWLKELPTTDPDLFVEEIPFKETKNYVRQVFGNYWNYLRLYNPEISQIVAKYSDEQPKIPKE
jgi:soluble lytic murein transglycosylase